MGNAQPGPYNQGLPAGRELWGMLSTHFYQLTHTQGLMRLITEAHSGLVQLCYPAHIKSPYIQNNMAGEMLLQLLGANTLTAQLPPKYRFLTINI